MYRLLPQGMKNSITRSIKSAFEAYMMNIKWDPALYNMDDFMMAWKESFEKGASWYEKIEDDIKSHASFHEGLAEKVNQVIDKILSEEVTEEQMEALTERYGADFSAEVSCQLEAKYYLDLEQ